jgi:hypothetical protein
MSEFCALGGRKEWSIHRDLRRQQWERYDKADLLREFWLMPERESGISVAENDEPEAIEEQFRRLAADWSEHTGHISSTSDLVSYPSYQKIISLGWPVVPFLLRDLQQSKRFWFPALYAITNVRPFDASDAGNGRRMTDAWIRWGKRKGLI